MALQKRNFPITFTKGVERGVDPKLVIPSKFTALENLEFNAKNTPTQRPGFQEQEITPHTGSSSIVNIQALHALGEYLLVESDSGMHSVLQGRAISLNLLNGSGHEKTFKRAHLALNEAGGSQRNRFGFDVARASPSGLECWVWTEQVDSLFRGVYYQIIDRTIGVPVQSGAVEGATGTVDAFNPRVVVRDFGGGSVFHIYFAATSGGATAIRHASLAVAVDAHVSGALSALVTVSNVAADVLGVFDACYSADAEDYVSLCFRAAAASDIRFLTLDGADGTSLLFARSRAFDGVLCMSTCTLVLGGFSQITVAFRSAFAPDPGIYITGMIGKSVVGGSVPVAVAAMVTGAPTGSVANLVVVASPFTSGKVDVFYDDYLGSIFRFDHDVMFVACNYDGSAGVAATPLVKGLVLAGRPSRTPDSLDLCVSAALPSTLQPTVFVLLFGGSANESGFGSGTRSSPRVLARLLPSLCVVDRSYRLPTVFASSSALHVPIASQSRAFFVAGMNVAPARLLLADVTPTGLLPLGAECLAGACLSDFDGKRLHEKGFHYYPEQLTATGGGTGVLTAGVYSCTIVYEWFDAGGRLHRSAPAVPVQVTVGAGAGVISVIAPSLRLTDKQDPADAADVSASPVKIALYRTEAGGTIYYRDSGPFATRDNSLDSNFVSVLGEISDADLISGEILYTIGGALENEAFPSANTVCTHQRRLFMAGDGFVQYTDESDDAQLAVATNEAYRIPVPSDGGKITGLFSMDDKLIIGCEHAIYFVYGEGANRLGQQSTYSLPQICSSKVGMREGAQQALALTPDGLWFLGPTGGGLRLLTRGLTIAVDPEAPDSLLGQAVDEYLEGLTRIEAQSIDSREAVYWYSDAGPVVVWNYHQHTFSTFTGIDSAGGSASARGQLWHSDGDSLFALDEVTGGQDVTLLDDPVSVSTVHETAWIPMAGLQGFQRAYAVQLLGQVITPCLIQLEVGYDYVEDYESGQTFDFTQSEEVNPLQIEHQLTRQVCEAVRFRIAAVTGGAPATGQIYHGYAVVFDAPFTGSSARGAIATGLTSGATAEVLYYGVAGPFAELDLITPAIPFQVGETVTTSDGFSGVVDFIDHGDDFFIVMDWSIPGAIEGGITLTGASSGATGGVEGSSRQGDAGFVSLIGRTGVFIDGETVEGPPAPGGEGEALRLTGMTLSVGLKGGLHRLPAAQRF